MYEEKTSIGSMLDVRAKKVKTPVIWFTGLSGSGKSTLAHALCEQLEAMEISACVLDGDNIRTGLSKDLGLSPEDRKENIRRSAEVAKLIARTGTVVICAFITPYEESRNEVRSILQEHPFVEVFLDCQLAECCKRDPKGLYEKACKGEIKGMTGMSAPFEMPEKPHLIVKTKELTIEQSILTLLGYLKANNVISGIGVEVQDASFSKFGLEVHG